MLFPYHLNWNPGVDPRRDREISAQFIAELRKANCEARCTDVIVEETRKRGQEKSKLELERFQQQLNHQSAATDSASKTDCLDTAAETNSGVEGDGASTCGWDKATEARNKWIYEECRKGTAYKLIKAKWKTKPKSWDRIESIGGIRRAAAAYAKRHNLEPAPKRRAGRPKNKRAP